MRKLYILVFALLPYFGLSSNLDVRPDVMPRFLDGGQYTFKYWILEKVSIPKEIRNRGITGSVGISFIVDKEGVIKDIEALYYPHILLADEVVGAIKRSKLKWKPAKKDRKPVDVKLTLDFEFLQPVDRAKLVRGAKSCPYVSGSAIVFQDKNGAIQGVAIRSEGDAFVYGQSEESVPVKLLLGENNAALGKVSWSDAKRLCEDKGERLPTMIEMSAICDLGGAMLSKEDSKNKKLLNKRAQVFQLRNLYGYNVLNDGGYWLSSSKNDKANYVDFSVDDWSEGSAPQDSMFYVRCVNDYSKIVKKPMDLSKPFVRSEVMPKFKGGSLSVFQGWVRSQVKYPTELKKSGVQGTVLISFVVDQYGQVGDIYAMSSPIIELTQQVVRIIESSPKWKPGMQRGKPVSVRYVLPVNFRL